MFILLFLCGLAVTQAQNLQVNTTEGWIVGNIASNGVYHVFYGIPYAGPAAPTPPSRYPGLFHAMDSNIICAQPSANGLIGIENCLTLSIYTNNVTTPKPVVVWLNAEEYTTSSTTLYSFRRFIEEGIVVVSMNFRLSIFGFLCLGVPEAPGNAGLKDVIQGLNWIKTNIAGFGGNPNNVALFGHGSAAAIVDLITISPRAQNLVHKAVALSGSALAPWAVAYDPAGYANILGEKLSYNGKSRSELAKLLISTDINVLGSALNGFKFTNNTPLFAPCIEDKNLNANETVLTDAPINLLRAGNYSHIPYIAGYVNREGTLRAEEAAFDQWRVKMQNNFTDFLQVDLDFGTNRTAMAQSIRDFYFSGSPNNLDIEDYLDYHGDTLVLVSVIRGARERAATSRSEVRLLEFAYMGTLNSDWSYHEIPLKGVKHGGLLNYMFDFDLRPADEAIMRSVVKRLATFAHVGSPVITGNPTIEWPAISNDRLYYLYYSGNTLERMDGPNTTSVEQPKFDPHSTKMTFWNPIYSSSYKAPVPVSSARRVVGFLYVCVFSIIFVRLF
ncbi:Carboxylesterase ae27 [Operophtera brumata]|uniref:Carboxylesterase ae27 n=1 Tax=Operophtera brumata TaxID=104452 RepID=A0A0L7LDE4_OPEBR|nr:Carboxylesterase ae27 [Operophtera brumata]